VSEISLPNSAHGLIAKLQLDQEVAEEVAIAFCEIMKNSATTKTAALTIAKKVLSDSLTPYIGTAEYGQKAEYVRLASDEIDTKLMPLRLKDQRAMIQEIKGQANSILNASTQVIADIKAASIYSGNVQIPVELKAQSADLRVNSLFEMLSWLVENCDRILESAQTDAGGQPADFASEKFADILLAIFRRNNIRIVKSDTSVWCKTYMICHEEINRGCSIDTAKRALARAIARSK